MKLEKIKLNNIRSFIDQEISFPDGSILLSGDIGSGKSTILLAMEFALFGLLRADLSGSQILRNGSNSGSVTLNFNVKGKNVEIYRVLKLGKSITQDSGYISVDGVKEELTANELKQRILELLNYPKELLTKSKSFIYRYTVYTPQEEMKRILTEKKEDRLDTLRRVFGIDKYKRVKDNAKVLTTYLRETRKTLEGRIEDLGKLKLQKIEFETREKEFSKSFNDKEILIKDCSSRLDEKKVQLLDAEKSKKFSIDIEILDRDLQNKILRQKDNDEIVNVLVKDILEMEREIVKIEGKDYDKDIEEVRKVISEIGERISEKNNKKSYLEAKKETSSETKRKISEIDLCPVCKQEVMESHKHDINETEDKNILSYDNEVKTIESERIKLNEDLENKNKELEELTSKPFLK